MGLIVNWLVKRILRSQTQAAYRSGFNLVAWRRFMEGIGKGTRLPKGVTSEAAVMPTGHGVWLRPPHSSARYILYLHGGMYVGGSTNNYRELIGRLAEACEANILAVDYRLAPEHPFPAAVQDARAAFDWLADNHGVPVVMGDSAGAGLAMTLLRDNPRPPPAAVLLSPWVDLTFSGASFEERRHRDPLLRAEGLRAAAALYLAETPTNHPHASPLFNDLSGLPPLQIHVGTEEVLHDDATQLAERARSAGVDVELVVWDGMVHVFQTAARLLHEGRQSIAQIGAFVRSRTP